uniref:ral guanine nucleotide dissociation stimulator-like n=1 Tax=Jaculus jaculus TaxID=51337 RepID=UPI001E1AFA21|nr:ral guanine nucleotide dissociation stimulator-like [Jaculus jaculus]
MEGLVEHGTDKLANHNLTAPYTPTGHVLEQNGRWMVLVEKVIDAFLQIFTNEEHEWRGRFDPSNPNYVKNLVDYLPPAVLNSDFQFVANFLAVYPEYTTTWDLLDLIMKRYPRFQLHNESEENQNIAYIYFLSEWIEKFPQDFTENPDMTVVNKLMDYLNLNTPGSELLKQFQSLFPVLNEKNNDTSASQEPARALGLHDTGDAELQAPNDSSGMAETLDGRTAGLQEELEPSSDLVAGTSAASTPALLLKTVGVVHLLPPLAPTPSMRLEAQNPQKRHQSMTGLFEPDHLWSLPKVDI